LWNWRLVEAVRRTSAGSLLGKVTIRLIVLLDTAFLALRALRRRASRIGIRGLLSGWGVPTDVPILYFDLGTHKKARELSFMVSEVLPRASENFAAYGFEACRESWEEAQTQFTGRENVCVVHAALCHLQLPDSGTIRLYKGQGDGLEASIYRQGLDEYDEVRALRFSDWLRENHLSLEDSICLLRMNIEGAEFDIIQDLLDHDLAGFIDGYYGMWDDVSKIDPRRGDDFRSLLAANHINPFTFNGRDFRFRLRKKCIEYDVCTSIRAGLRRVRAGRRGWTQPAGEGHNQG
jgi:hypothetical protein